MSVWAWLAAALLGGAGSICRFALDRAVVARAGRSFPLGTLAVNASGALLLGLLAGLALRGNAMVLIGTALLGSYTTFSTWMLETHRLAEDAELAAAAANAFVSLAFGFGAVAIGHALGHAIGAAL